MEYSIDFKNNKLYYRSYSNSFSMGSYINFNEIRTEKINELISQLNQLIERRENEQLTHKMPTL